MNCSVLVLQSRAGWMAREQGSPHGPGGAHPSVEEKHQALRPQRPGRGRLAAGWWGGEA